MAIQTQEAILLKKRDLRETSFVVTFLTRDFGKIYGILKGARGVHSNRKTNPLFFGISHIVYYEKKKNDFFIISHNETERVFFNIVNDWDRLSCAYYMLELADVFTEPGVESKELFESLAAALESLDEKKEPMTIARLFEMKLLKTTGLWPGASRFNLTKGAMSTLTCFENERWGTASRIKLTRDVGIEIKEITSRLITDNLDKPLKTGKVFAGDI